MFRVSLFFISLLFFGCQQSAPTSTSSEAKDSEDRAEYAIAIHGGAGTILKKNMTPEREISYRSALDSALTIGETILSEGGSALDAVEQTIHYLEDSPLFNAGKGAVFTHDLKNELDASIMQGHDQNAGAVGGLSTVRHPISAARAVMEKSEHVLLTGAGAEAFSRTQGLEVVDPSFFKTEQRWNSIKRVLAEDMNKTELSETDETGDKKHGTVGCVALDKSGNLVAGTSTGGMTNKRFNRFGDVPIIGAGTYADNATCAVSCTGHGEYFIRYAVAHDVHARMLYLKEPLEEAADHVVNTTLIDKGGSGGLISVDHKGNVSLPFNSAGMYRGYAKPGERMVAIYDDEETP